MQGETHSFRIPTVNASFLTLLFLLAAAFVVPRAVMAANLVQNPGFETGDLTNWYVTGDPGNMHVGSDDPHSGAYAFDGSPTGGEGYVNQDFSGLGNNQYNLQFYIDQRNTNGNLFQVLWDGQLIYQLLNSGQTGYHVVQLNGLQASGGTETLSFGFIGSGQTAWSLDDVDLEQVGTPEPGSLVLMGSGVLGLAGVLRRRLL